MKHRGVGLGDLRHLLVHLAYGPAGPDDVREVVALPQLLTQMSVLGQQPPALVLHRPLNLQRLRDHRGDDSHELHAAVEIAFGLEPQIDAEGADGLAVERGSGTHTKLSSSRPSSDRRARDAGNPAHG